MQFPLVELVLFFLLFRVPLFNDVAFISFFCFFFALAFVGCSGWIVKCSGLRSN